MAKKKLLFFSIFIIIILVFVLTIYNIIYKNNNIYLNNKDEAPNFISIMLEETASSGEYKVSKSNKWPSKGYVFNKEMSYCNYGSTLTWNENDNSVSVNINKTDKCYVYFDIYVPTLVEYVKSQYTGTQGENGLYYHDSTLANGAGDNSYRYAGASDSVNNYICLGSDTTTCPDANLFRIIGVFGDKTKVIRAKSVGNPWSNIETSVPKIVYKNEVGSSASTTTVDKKIGLMYISDYYYSASPSAWTLVGYNKSDATKDYSAAKTINWLYLGSKEWTISRVSDETFSAFIVDGSGHVFSYNVNFSNFAVRPSFNLDSTVTYVSGDGTKSNPIRIN